MTYQSTQNKWLIIRPDVVLTDIIDPVIAQLDPFFEQAQHSAFVTSGLRDAKKQVQIIVDLANKNELQDYFPKDTISFAPNFKLRWSNDGELVYWWQPVWSALLNRGVIVNPPLPAKTLADYYRKDETTGELILYKPAGYLIGASPHFNGTAFDIGGGEDKDISNELEIVRTATKDGAIKGFKGVVVERNNNCVHCDCEHVA